MSDAIKNIVLPFALIVAGFAGVIFLTGFIEGKRPPLPENLSDADLNMNGSRLKGFAFGMEGLAADWYYMRSLQYIGDKMMSRPDIAINIEDLRAFNPRLLHPLLENATDLDPQFIAAYTYGAMILPAIDHEKAIALVSKGIANNPDEWRLHQQLGYVYWRLGRYDEAAGTYEKGSAIKGSPPFMKMMAASMRSDGASREAFRAIYSEMLANSEDEQMREMAGRRLREIASLDEKDAIDKVLEDFKTRNGRCANNWEEITTMLMSARLPDGREFRVDNTNRLVDPNEAPYVLDREECKVKVEGQN